MSGRGKRRALDRSNSQAVTTALADLLTPSKRDATLYPSIVMKISAQRDTAGVASRQSP